MGTRGELIGKVDESLASGLPPAAQSVHFRVGRAANVFAQQRKQVSSYLGAVERENGRTPSPIQSPARLHFKKYVLQTREVQPIRALYQTDVITGRGLCRDPTGPPLPDMNSYVSASGMLRACHAPKRREARRTGTASKALGRKSMSTVTRSRRANSSATRIYPARLTFGQGLFGTAHLTPLSVPRYNCVHVPRSTERSTSLH